MIHRIKLIMARAKDWTSCFLFINNINIKILDVLFFVPLWV